MVDHDQMNLTTVRNFKNIVEIKNEFFMDAVAHLCIEKVTNRHPSIVVHLKI